MTNIIDFAKAKEQMQMQQLTDLIASQAHLLNDNEKVPLSQFSLDYSLMVARDILTFLEEIGYDLTVNENLIYDIMMIVETNKAMIYRLHGEEHAMHSVAEDIFEIEDPYKTLQEILDDLLED